jgi:hypothetical protein
MDWILNDRIKKLILEELQSIAYRNRHGNE